MDSEQELKLGECRECAGTVSKDAAACPHCGAREPLNQSFIATTDTPKLVQRLQGDTAAKTTLVACRECKGTISPTASLCPHCGAPFPANPRYRSGGEWVSQKMVGDRPLVHVAWGRNPQTGKMRVAKGVIAIGQFAKGDIAIGQFAFGKYFALGQFAASWVAAIGQFAAAPLAIGMLAIGAFIIALIGVGLKLIGGGIGMDGFHHIAGGHARGG